MASIIWTEQKGGMDKEEFAKYLFNSIVPLFPHEKDKPGHRVLLNMDSGPGQMNLNLLAKLRLLGFVLYPCVPNTTHVMQETDQNYGPFKTQFNLDLIVDKRLTAKKSLSLQQKFVDCHCLAELTVTPSSTLKWVLSRRHSYDRNASKHTRRLVQQRRRESHVHASTIHKCCETSAVMVMMIPPS